MSISVTVRSLSGTSTVELSGEDATPAKLREVAGLLPGFSLRRSGEQLAADDELRDGDVVIASPPEAKHG